MSNSLVSDVVISQHILDGFRAVRWDKQVDLSLLFDVLGRDRLP